MEWLGDGATIHHSSTPLLHYSTLRFASTTTPIIAASRINDVTSNAKPNCGLNNVCPTY